MPFWPHPGKERALPGTPLNSFSAWRVNLFEQPYDEIREYYGDHVAIYFVWLGKYTFYMIWPAIFGSICQIGNFYNKDGVDGNPLLMPYSVFLAFWATIFLQMWERKQAELKVWGVPTAWTILEQDGPNHLGCDAMRIHDHRMALINSDCVP